MIEQFVEGTGGELRLGLGAILILIGLPMAISTLFNSQKSLVGDILSLVSGSAFAAAGGYLLLTVV